MIIILSGLVIQNHNQAVCPLMTDCQYKREIDQRQQFICLNLGLAAHHHSLSYGTCCSTLLFLLFL